MWFDVENERYTTPEKLVRYYNQLWFDVENERYTTAGLQGNISETLWFDVENERYTTATDKKGGTLGCGLM